MKLVRRFKGLAPADRPQDPSFDGTTLRFEVIEHGGEYDDAMPQAIKVTDTQDRSCIYVPLSQEGQVVDSRASAVADED